MQAVPFPGLEGPLRLPWTVARDDRGSFETLFEAEAFAQAGLPARWTQTALVRNRRAHTLRGLHYQEPPWGQAKLVACLRGSLFDVLVDLRPESPTHLQHVGCRLAAGSGEALFVPPGFAHGYLTLEEATEVLYLLEGRRVPAQERGLRWNDPALGICWPLGGDPILSERDARHPLWTAAGR